MPTILDTSATKAVKELIGTRLKEHATYRPMLREKQRCWRIDYANEFHLDITPSIANPRCHQGGELVPDKSMAQWKPTNPHGYISKFEEYVATNPSFESTIAPLGGVRADVALLPEQTVSKPILKRIVQLLKRHRDKMFINTDRSDLAPISVIITTLASRAYHRCATQQIHANLFDLIIAVIREMPKFIKTEERSGKQFFIIENETTIGENFADKWNHDTRLATSFYTWHKDILTSFESLLFIEGTDQFAICLSHKFGAKKEHIRNLLSSITSSINKARSEGTLFVAPSLGVITSPVYGSAAVPVPKNTFFGL